MSSQANDEGWILHSLAQSRRYGPMTEDELRGYFRAGMVKSVDRLSAPGESTLRSAAEVATMLGLTVPAGPPPPEPTGAPPPPPAISAAVARDPTSDEERAARAAAAMNIDIASLMATSAPASRRSSWLVPVIAVAVLVLMLFVALRMLRNFKPAAPVAARADIGAPLDTPSADPMPGLDRDAAVPASNTGARVIPASAGSEADLQVRNVQAQKLQNAGDWAGLSAYASAWLQTEPGRSEPLLLLGMAETRLGNHAQAISAIQQVLAREPGHAGAQALLADAYLQAQRFAEAAALYGKLVAASADDARLWNNYGAALNAAGQQAQAVAALETAVRLDPTFKQAWTNLGNVYQSTGDTARASAAFANAR